MTHWPIIADHISQSLNKPIKIQNQSPVGGGSINSAYKITTTDKQAYFVKLNSANLEFMFRVEFDALNELSQANIMQIPKPICFGTTLADSSAPKNHSPKSYLVLEYCPMKSSGDGKKMGHALAQMHKITSSQYGWYQNNMIGSTPQSNRRHSDWLTFWREERMRPQFEMLYEKGYQAYLSPLSDRLMETLDHLLGEHNPPASLLHGDLWSGNYAYNQQGKPVIFDPALYYGDRETDLAMTELFGGFNQDFYRSYNEVWALDEAYKKRKTLYNLYHILNHANLFGTSYLHQAISMMEKLC